MFWIVAKRTVKFNRYGTWGRRDMHNSFFTQTRTHARKHARHPLLVHTHLPRPAELKKD
jgi:hypothetical protein